MCLLDVSCLCSWRQATLPDKGDGACGRGGHLRRGIQPDGLRQVRGRHQGRRHGQQVREPQRADGRRGLHGRHHPQHRQPRRHGGAPQT